jgi:hypothetical protein
MTTEQDKQKNKSREPKTGNNTLPDTGKHKKVIPRDDKFSPGEPDDYNAEEFATD